MNLQGVCRGCGRTMDEIAAWPTASDARKRAIIDAARARRAATRPPRR